MIKTKNIIFLVNYKINFATLFTTPGSWKITYFYVTTTTFTTAWFWQKQYYFYFHYFYFSTTSTSSINFAMSWSREFFVSFLCYVHYIMIKWKKNNLVTTFTTPWSRVKNYFFIKSLHSLRHDQKKNLFFHFGTAFNKSRSQKKKFDFYCTPTLTTLCSFFILLGRSLWKYVLTWSYIYLQRSLRH